MEGKFKEKGKYKEKGKVSKFNNEEGKGKARLHVPSLG